MQIIPAIDLRAGRVVRLAQGDYARETRYAPGALDLAQAYARSGATWLHVVDLDGARSGALENLRVIEAIAGGGLRLQAGGGVRGAADVERLFDAGVERVVVGHHHAHAQRPRSGHSRHAPQARRLAKGP